MNAEDANTSVELSKFQWKEMILYIVHTITNVFVIGDEKMGTSKMSGLILFRIRITVVFVSRKICITM